MSKRKAKAAVFEPEIMAIDDLKPHPRNYKVHTSGQVAHIIASIKKHGFYKNIVVAEDGTILAGHGMVIAARKMGYVDIPVIRQAIAADHPDALAILAGDNEIALLADRDDAALAGLLSELGGIDPALLLGTGWDMAMLAGLDSTLTAPAQEVNYTRKIEAPLYVPSGEKPALKDLYDTSRTDALVKAIYAANLSDDLTAFLIVAAQRHTVLKFDFIADYYAHAPANVQRLMEDSALVIIDFNRAIELGYVTLTNRISELVQGETNNSDEEDDE